MNQTQVNREQIAEWRKLHGKGLVSAVGEYTPDEFWLLLDSFERLERDLAKANADKAVLVEALTTIKDKYGQVCAEYELCTHPACFASYGSWAEADAALSQVQA